MKLYNKVLSIVGILALIFIISILFLSNKILVNEFVKIEDSSIISNMERVNNAMNEEVNNLSGFVNDYSAWDDSYNFSKDKNEEYITSNFSGYTTFQKMRINFIIYTDKDGKVILSKGFNLNLNKEELPSQELQTEIKLKVKNLTLMKHSESIKGITEINNTPTIFIIEPITTSDGIKSSGGHMIAGRYIDKQQILNLSSRVKVNLNVEKYNKNIKQDKNIKWDNNAGVEDTNKNSAVGYKILPDIENNPYLVIKIDIIRQVYNQATKSVIYFVIVFTLISLSLAGIALIYFNKIVAKRITKMKLIIDNSGSKKNTTMRMKAEGNDEIASLAAGFNNLQDELFESSDKIEISQNKYYSLISNMISCFLYSKVVVDQKGVTIDFIILDCNNALCEYIHFKREEIVGRKISEFIDFSKIDMDAFNEFVEVAELAGCKKVDEVFFQNAKRWILATAYSIEKGYFALMFNDITEKKKTEQKNLELANKDMLTGLPNRKMIMDKINAIIDINKIAGGKFAILFIDLDNFKKVNDSLGHDVGDILIQNVGARLKSIIAPTDVVARIGGDEFIILQDGIDSKGETEDLAESIGNVLKASFRYIDNEIYIAASIGISIYPDDGVNISSLMKNSDIAMYETKKNGGNSYRLYSANMDKTGVTNLILESNLYKALENNEMILYYQAITHVESESIIGFEALIRWNHNDKLVSPIDFIPMAENNGYIIELGEWVLREACKQCSDWHKNGINTYITVNITFKQLEQDNFVDIVCSALKDAELKSNYLVLEITENMAMHNVDLTIDMLNRIKNLGVSIALDDFGTGYSSLSYVNRLPIDIIKIDRSLIISIVECMENIEIIKAIIAMAISLNIKVIVEGVEKVEQYIILKKLETYAIQGYLISKPLPATDVKPLIEGKLDLP